MQWSTFHVIMSKYFNIAFTSSRDSSSRCFFLAKISCFFQSRSNRIRHLSSFSISSFFSRKKYLHYSCRRVSLPTYFVGYSWIGISVGKPAISFIKSNWTRVGGFVESNYMLMARFAWQLSFVSQSASAELAFGPLRFRWWPMSVLVRPPL